MRDWLPGGHLVWFVIDLVDQLDLGEFRGAATDPRGRRRYDPAVLVTLLVYAYCVGERSSRRIERRCVEDVAFRVAAAGLAPDHTTISRFIKDHAEAFDALFAQVLRLARQLGMGKVGTVFIDGTKVAADASPLAAKTRDTILDEVQRITDEARRTDAAEDAELGDRRGDELPEDLAEPASRKARLREALRRIEADEAADAERPPSRRRTKPAKANVTDPQCRVMKGPRGYFPAYNAQSAASEDGLVLAADVTDQPTDNHLFDPMVGQACDNLAAAGMAQPDTACADNGYWTNNNATHHRDTDTETPSGTEPATSTETPSRSEPPRRRPEPIIAPPTDKRRRPIATRGPIPQNATPAQIMERKLATRRGKAIYRRRAATIEPVFGHLKAARGITRFRRRGLTPARHEWRLIATTHNVLKMWRYQLAT